MSEPLSVSVAVRRVTFAGTVYRVTTFNGHLHRVDVDGGPQVPGAVVGPLTAEPPERQWAVVHEGEVVAAVESLEAAAATLHSRSRGPFGPSRVYLVRGGCECGSDRRAGQDYCDPCLARISAEHAARVARRERGGRSS